MKVTTMTSRLLDPSMMYGLINTTVRCTHVWGVDNKNNGVLWVPADGGSTVVSSSVDLEVQDDTYTLTHMECLGVYKTANHPDHVTLPDKIDIGLVLHRNVLEHYLRMAYPDHVIDVLAMDHVSMKFILQYSDRFELRRYDLVDGNIEVVGMPLAKWLI